MLVEAPERGRIVHIAGGGRRREAIWEFRIKIGAKVVTHARHVIFQMAEVAVPKPFRLAGMGSTIRLKNESRGVYGEGLRCHGCRPPLP